MTVFDRIYNAALLPQIKTGSADDAVLAAKALLSGGVPFGRRGRGHRRGAGAVSGHARRRAVRHVGGL